MITSELHSLVCLLIVCLSAISVSAGRCYLCSESTLRECVGNNQPDSSMYTSVLRYYTEPCNGQCVLFRNHNGSIQRGCSWTYGHMTPKSIGWHEISPRIQAYFCDSHLCNNGTIDQPEIAIRKIGTAKSPLILSPHELFLLAGNDPLLIQTGLDLSRQSHHCYSCTARYEGCGEFLDPHYAPTYIRPCTSSCVIFRNPNDLNLITRDCSTLWPQVPLPNGFQKLLGSDAFFCRESLCNGISFDFIMGIYHNQLPTIITFAPVSTNENTSLPSTATTMRTTQTTVDIYNDSMIWDDPDLDYGLIESSTSLPSDNVTGPSAPVDDFDFIDESLSNSTLISELVTDESNSSLNAWTFNNTSMPSPSSSPILVDDEDHWIVFNTTSELPVSRYDHLSADDDFLSDWPSNAEGTITGNDSNATFAWTTTATIDPLDNDTQSIFLDVLQDDKLTDQSLEYMQPFPSFAMPPFSWILSMINQSTSEASNSTTTTLTTTTTSHTSSAVFEYCGKKQCQHGGRLNSDCLCICLPAYTGDSCETVLCDEEPVHICAFVLEHECEVDQIRYLCPKFCQLQDCSSNQV